MKKTAVLIALVLLLLGAFTLCAAAETVDSGTCGENLTWVLDDAGTLTISGTGAMEDYTASNTSPFSNNASVKAVLIGNGVTSIGEQAFYHCTGLTSVSFPNSLTDIGEKAFYQCTALASVTLPEGVTSVGEAAFCYCSALTTLSISNSVTDIERWAFYDCSALQTLSIGSIIERESLDSLGIPDENLQTVIIPNGVKRICEKAFYSCENLTAVTIPNTVARIGNSAFAYCDELTGIKLPNSVTDIGSEAFSSCRKLTEITIPDSVTNIGTDAFAYCGNLRAIKVASGNPVYHSQGNCLIHTADKMLILGCAKSVIPADGSVTSIGRLAFAVCSALTSIRIPDSVAHIGDWAFYWCTALTSIKLPDSVTGIGEKAFYHCTSLACVTLSNSMRDIGENAFGECTELTAITIPNSVTSIGLYAFADCSNLAAITLSSSVKMIWSYAFTGCDNLTDVYYLGTSVQLNTVSVLNDNEPFIEAAVHYIDNISEAPDGHTWDKGVINKATLTKDGRIVLTCTACGATKTSTKIAKASKVTIDKTKFVYNGKVQKPTLTVKNSAGNVIASKYYTAKWSNAKSKAVGSYTVTVTFKGNYSGTKTLIYTIVPKQVTGVKNAAATTKSVKLTWTKATGAKYYEVYGSTDNKTFKKITTVSTNSLNVTKVNGKTLAAGKTYYFKVRALDSTKKLIGAFSSVLKTGTLTAAPKISKLTSTKSKTATVTWGKVTGAKKYVVYKSTDGKKWTKAGTSTGTSFTLTGLTGGKKIYVKVLAVNAYSQKSADSAVKSVTVKK